MATAKKKPAASSDAPPSAPPFRVVGKEEKPPAARGGLNLGGLTAKPAAKGKIEKPIVTVGEEMMTYLEQFTEHAPEYLRLDKLVGSKGSIKAALSPMIRHAYFSQFAGRVAPSSTMLVNVGGTSVKLITKSMYSTKCGGVHLLADAVGPDLAQRHFHNATILKIDMEQIAEEKQQPLVDAILAAAAELGIDAGITATECAKPNAGFHEARTTLLSLEQNLAVDQLIPVTAYPQL